MYLAGGGAGQIQSQIHAGCLQTHRPATLSISHSGVASLLMSPPGVWFYRTVCGRAKRCTWLAEAFLFEMDIFRKILSHVS